MSPRRLIGAFALVLCAGFSAPMRADCPPEGTAFPPFYTRSDLFLPALAATETVAPTETRLTGLTVPHHLVAAELIAGGLRLTAGSDYDRIVLIHPDHFDAATRAFATTPLGFETILGPVPGDPQGAAALLASGTNIQQSCLFSGEHGLRALLPFLARLHPGTPVLPVAVSIRSTEADWQALARALVPLFTDRTLVLQSTDFSHYLPPFEARQRDQETLNVIAAGDPEALRALRMPDHLDSTGAMYLQMALQARHGAMPIVVQNQNQVETGATNPESTTSYIVIAWGRFPAAAQDIGLSGSDTFLIAGDTFFGRSLTRILSDELAEKRLRDTIADLTAGLPLIVNLEGVLLEDVPDTLDPMVLGMPAELALHWVRLVNIKGVGLANNHARDVGGFGYDETVRLLRDAGVQVAGPGEQLDVGPLALVALTDLDNTHTGRRDLIDDAALAPLVIPDPARAVVAFIHWGHEGAPGPSAREQMLAQAVEAHGAAAIIGAHPHVASDRIALVGDTSAAMVYSLGNFIFDQTDGTASGALVELRGFPQGTVFLRRIPLPNLYQIARGD